jgi:hypothetical protein
MPNGLRRGPALCIVQRIVYDKETTMADTPYQRSWDDEDDYWRANYRTRPYASVAEYEYDYFRPAYQYGYDGASRNQGRSWSDVEPELARGWDGYEHRGDSTWEQMKDAVRDAWDRLTGSRTTAAGR